MSPDDLRQHILEDCPKATVVCKRCGVQVVRDQIAGHDCIRELKLKIAQIKGEAENTSFDRNNLDQYGIDEDDSNNALININAVIT